MSQFDSLIIGEVAQDTNVDYDGTTVHAVGGAVYYSGFAAANTGHKTAVLPQGGHGPGGPGRRLRPSPKCDRLSPAQQDLLCHKKTSTTPRTGSGAPPPWTASSNHTAPRRCRISMRRSGIWRAWQRATFPTR